MNVSVAMTTYNGEKFLQAQLDSIYMQINEDDEIIICDDGSTDRTLNILQENLEKDSRIKLYRNSGKGAVSNFEDAISKCGNDLIFLCDHDDIWHPNKVAHVKSAFEKTNKLLVLHNGADFYENNDKEEGILIPSMKHGIINNLMVSCYWGCCMAFKRELVKDILPFPPGLVAHDQWIGLIAELKKESFFLEESLISHRRHRNNVTKKQDLWGKIIFRIKMTHHIIQYMHS